MTFLVAVAVGMLFAGIMRYGTTAGFICYICGYLVLFAYAWLMERRFRNLELGLKTAIDILQEDHPDKISRKVE